VHKTTAHPADPSAETSTRTWANSNEPSGTIASLPVAALVIFITNFFPSFCLTSAYPMQDEVAGKSSRAPVALASTICPPFPPTPSFSESPASSGLDEPSSPKEAWGYLFTGTKSQQTQVLDSRRVIVKNFACFVLDMCPAQSELVLHEPSFYPKSL
jgi:hypothetical protein